MPINLKKDNSENKYYFQYGKTGHKYYSKDLTKSSLKNAYDKCLKQVKAIHSSKK